MHEMLVIIIAVTSSIGFILYVAVMRALRNSNNSISHLINKIGKTVENASINRIQLDEKLQAIHYLLKQQEAELASFKVRLTKLGSDLAELENPDRVLPKVWYKIETPSQSTRWVFAQRGITKNEEFWSKEVELQGYGEIKRQSNGSWLWEARLRHRSCQINRAEGFEPSRQTAQSQIEKTLREMLRFREEVDYISLVRTDASIASPPEEKSSIWVPPI